MKLKKNLMKTILGLIFLFIQSFQMNGFNHPPFANNDQELNANKFNEVLFDELIHQTFAGKVKGYSVVLVNANGVQAKVSGGFAQAPNDGNVLMKTNISSNLGSVSKMLTGMALLHLFENRKLFNGSVSEQLESKMYRQLPPKLQACRGKKWDDISYKQLLQHRSGIRNPENDKKNGWCFVVSKDISPANFDKRDYNNFNFSIFRFLIPKIAYPNRCAQIERKYQNLPTEQNVRKIMEEFTLLYEEYMQTEFFPKMLGQNRPTCRPAKDLPRNKFAKHYSNLAGTNGKAFDPKVVSPQGSWYMSAQELANFAKSFGFSNQLISASTRNLIFNPNNKNARLLYNKVNENEGFTQETGQRYWPRHGGTLKGYRAALIQLPYGFFGVALTNSPEFSSTQLSQILLNNFYKATRGRPISLAKHALPKGKYDKMVKGLAKHGSMPVWADFYTVNGKVFVNPIFHPTNYPWEAKHDLTGADYQREFDNWVKRRGYRLKFIDSYVKQGKLLYACAFIKRNGSQQLRYHGVSKQTHVAKMQEFESRGFAPKVVSISSLNGKRYFTAIYVKKNVGKWEARSFLTTQQYEQKILSNKEQNRELVYVNAYNHNGRVYYSAIWWENNNRPYKERHNLTSNSYQNFFNQFTKQGFNLQLVTAAQSQNGQHRFAAKWFK